MIINSNVAATHIKKTKHATSSKFLKAPHSCLRGNKQLICSAAPHN
jgi:hypothetical protein